MLCIMPNRIHQITQLVSLWLVLRKLVGGLLLVFGIYQRIEHRLDWIHPRLFNRLLYVIANRLQLLLQLELINYICEILDIILVVHLCELLEDDELVDR